MISIATRLRPFSHLIGAQCIIPGTDEVIEAFPDFLQIGDLKIPLENDPFDRDFTLQQDLERNCVWVFGKKYRIKITARIDGFEMTTPKETKFFKAKVQFHLPKEIERLSLGSHRAQDWELMLRRLDMKEILPVLYLLSQKVPPLSPERVKETSDEEITFDMLEDFYRSSFHHMAVPRTIEQNVLKKAFEKVRSLFVIENENQIHLLPNNPFPEGRMLNIQTEMGSMDMEWTKKRLRRATLRVCKTGDVVLNLPKEIRSFRSKEHLQDKGKIFKNGDSLRCIAGKCVYLDRFFE